MALGGLNAGTAFIAVKPSLRGWDASVATQLRGQSAAAAAAGKETGSRFSTGLKTALAAGGALAVAGFAKQAVSLEAQFSKTMNVLKATTNASGREMERLSALAMKMGADTVFSANDASKAMLELARGGIKPAEIEAGALQGTLTLAAAGELEMGEAANVAVKALGAFGLAGKDMGAVAAALAGGANASSASVRDMGFALAQGGLAAKNAGLSVQEATGVLAAFSNAGLEGSDAGTSMKTMLSNLYPTTKRAIETMDMYNLSFVDAKGNFKDITEIAGLLQTKLGHLSEVERARTLEIIFGSDAQRAATVLMNEGAAGIEKYIKATSDQAAAEKMAAANMKGTAGALERLKGAVETVTLQFGLWLQPWVMRGLGGVTAGINAIVPAAKAVGGFIANNATTFKVLLGVTVALIAATKLHAAVMAVQAAGGLLKMARATRLVTALTRTYAAVQWVLNAALSNNPIGKVIMVLAALGTAVVLAYRKSETFRNIVQGVWKVVQAAVSLAWNRYYKPILTALWRALQTVWQGFGTMKTKATDAWASLKQGAKTAALWVVDKVLWMAEKMLGAMGTAFSWVPGLGDKLKKASGAIAEFRKEVNREMDSINDEEVRIGFAVGRRKSAEGKNTGFGPQANGGGAGRAGTGAHARAAGGALNFRPELAGARTGVSNIAASVSATAKEMATELAAKERRRLRRRAQSGAMGKAGRVLPRGRYSIGMPYLGYPGHYGADYPAATGTPVHSLVNGVVTRAMTLSGSYGKHVYVAGPGGVETRYAHLNSYVVRPGQRVRSGQQIGTVGSTGNSTGPHLHFEYRRNGASINPASLGVFDRGGLLRTGGVAINLSGRNERILDPRTTETFERFTAGLLANQRRARVVEAGVGRAGAGAAPTIVQNFPASTTPEAAAEASGGRVVATLSAWGI